MIDGRGVRSDCLFKMHLGVIEGDRHEKHTANETCGDAGDALGHTQPFIKSVGVQKAVRGLASGWMIN